MIKKTYNSPLTCADLILVGMGQLMENSTDPSETPIGNEPVLVAKRYI